MADDISNDLIIAALEYLGSVGDDNIEVNWPKLIGSSEANIARAAVCASARITARTNTAEALSFVAHHESTDLGKELAEELLKNISTIETEVLRDCLKNKTAVFVKVIANELSRRAALTKTDAQLLCENADAEIRLIGVKALAEQNSSLTLQDARKLLVKPRKSNTLNFLTSPKERDYPGESALTEFKIDALSKLSFGELTELQKDESFFSTDITLAIYSTQFKTVKNQLAKDLLDGFKNFFTERRAPLLGTSAEPSASVFEFVCDGLLQSAFEVFCSKASKADLVTVRNVLDIHDIKFAETIAEFLAKHGEWEDALRLAKLSQNLKYGAGLTLLSIVDHSSDYRLAARSILKLSSKRIADAWKMELSTSVRVQLVIHMPKQLFSAFENQSIIDMLLMPSDLVREAVALKAVLCLSKSRLNKILDAYYNVDGNYFYNVIFWLDLGISADRATSQAVAFKEIAAK